MPARRSGAQLFQLFYGFHLQMSCFIPSKAKACGGGQPGKAPLYHCG
jgi:hypothetical protein